MTFSLTPGQHGDAPAGRNLLRSLPPPAADMEMAMVMDRKYGGDETRRLALDLGFTPVVPPKRPV